MKERTLRNIFLVALLAASALPLFNILAVYPAFVASIANSAENHSIPLAGHLAQHSKALNTPVDRLGDSKQFLSEIVKIERDFGVMKIKAYAPDGRITYSTDKKEIGGGLLLHPSPDLIPAISPDALVFSPRKP